MRVGDFNIFAALVTAFALGFFLARHDLTWVLIEAFLTLLNIGCFAIVRRPEAA